MTRRLALLRDTSCRAAAANVVLGERMRAYFAARGIPPAQLIVIPNWADPGLIRPLPVSASELRRRLGLAGRFVVGYSGNLGRVHDVETLLGAAEALREDPSVSFLMVGGGAGMRALAEAVERRGLASFTFAPYQPSTALADALAASDVHLVSLRPALEGFVVPSKLYGILAAGRPVLFCGDPAGEIALELDRSGSGISVADGDAGALVAAIRRLRAEPATRERLAVAAHAAFTRCYTLDHAAQRWRELLGAIG